MTKNILDNHVKAYQGNNIYDFDNEIMLKWYPKRILELSQSTQSLLELGLGHGYSTNIFSNHYKNYLVLDGAKSIIDNFKQNYPNLNVNIKETFFEDFNSPDKYDVIVLGFILEHVDNPQEILKKYKKNLSENGKMYIAVPNAEAMNRRLGVLSNLLENHEKLSENDLLLGHQRYYSVKSLTEEVINAGLKITCTEGIYLKPFTTNQIVSLNLDNNIINSLCKLGINYPELSCGILMEVVNPN